MKLREKSEIILQRPRKSYELVVAAHHDDIEIMCPQGIVNGYLNDEIGLVAVVVADGAGSPRAGKYKDYTNEEMMRERIKEQKEAARLGDYAALILLNYTSGEIKDKDSDAVVQDVKEIINEFNPKTIYTHNPADKHPTHTAVCERALKAARESILQKETRMFGLEVWRGLDWLSDAEKVVFDVSGYDALLNALLSAHRSQVAGGKRYDLAAEGRRRANATYSESHGVDKTEMASYGIDLTPLLNDTSMSLRDFIVSKIEKFKDEILVK